MALTDAEGCTKGGHVLVVAYPAQGHINPIFHFAVRLAAAGKGTAVTFVTTEKARSQIMKAKGLQGLRDIAVGAVALRLESFSDGLPSNFTDWTDFDAVNKSLCNEGNRSLEQLIRRLNTDGPRVTCVAYDSFLYWVPPVAVKLGTACAFLWTQSSAVLSLYFHAYTSGAQRPADDNAAATLIDAALRDNAGFDSNDLPSFLQPSDRTDMLLQWFMQQLSVIGQYDIRLFISPSFDDLEVEEIQRLRNVLPAPFLLMGPLVPPEHGDSAAHMWRAAECSHWLDSMKPKSVVYVSFGSMGLVSKEQVQEVALALRECRNPFLWVIPPTSPEAEDAEEKGFPRGFLEETQGRGMLVSWCAQTKVLRHEAVGAFVSHCGWNSTMEGVAAGVPMLCVPTWSDQTTNSAFISKVWCTGVRPGRESVSGIFRKDELVRCLRLLLEGEDGASMREKARWLSERNRAAFEEEASSRRNTQMFLEQVADFASASHDRKATDKAGDC
eukprot:TRINITY_DN32890_c0_g1_i1.p1 TRINITY_DN32890_c0_g1~~TRINITY_DN32890_c0_g1_i1.p1  ORF type:complete len:514 (-),score=-0.29 TRINITY_DN32890_c0_g1_i1:101-1591(-)